ncbi:hypothetical protein Q7P37_011524 [Cladosporium fusiforme]
MLTQPIPYGPPPAAQATYQPINTSNRPSISTRTSTSDASTRKLSLHSIRSNTSWNSTSTWTSNASSKTTKSFKNLLRSLRFKHKSEATSEAEDDDCAEILHEQGRRKSKRVSRNPDAEKMFTWAALGVYSYPGAGPIVGWF